MTRIRGCSAVRESSGRRGVERAVCGAGVQLGSSAPPAHGCAAGWPPGDSVVRTEQTMTSGAAAMPPGTARTDTVHIALRADTTDRLQVVALRISVRGRAEFAGRDLPHALWRGAGGDALTYKSRQPPSRIRPARSADAAPSDSQRHRGPTAALGCCTGPVTSTFLFTLPAHSDCFALRARKSPLIHLQHCSARTPCCHRSSWPR